MDRWINIKTFWNATEMDDIVRWDKKMQVFSDLPLFVQFPDCFL